MAVGPLVPGRPRVPSSSPPGTHSLGAPGQTRCPQRRQSLPGRPPSSPCPAGLGSSSAFPVSCGSAGLNNPDSEAASSFEVLCWCLHTPTHAWESTAQWMQKAAPSLVPKHKWFCLKNNNKRTLLSPFSVEMFKSPAWGFSKVRMSSVFKTSLLKEETLWQR